ncbi:hypothetical protein [Kordia jejudonensis]|uniref:hypothetical protein n=1 Tax=Kordia jejudonensis TaxID=1348245 RepID=UPI000629B264|nr:hypothetical protein [Kordia jejudonensis]
MDSFWNSIDSDQFQEIAYAYARFLKPEWNWKATKGTNYNSQNDKLIPKTNTKDLIKKNAWYEAKYAKDSSHEIPLGKVAATVLIGFNNVDVESILIVTNAKFATKTIFEIQKILNNRIIFVLGDELKSWVLDEKQRRLVQKYGLITDKNTPLTSNISLLNDVFITKPNIIYNAISTSTETLIIGEEYILQCVISIPLSTKQSSFTFKIINTSEYISINRKDDITISQLGIGLISIPFTPIKEGSFSGSLLSLFENEHGVSLPIEKSIATRYNKNILLEIRSQIDCEFNLLQGYNNFIENSGTFLFAIRGLSGSGKSWVIENFIHSKKGKLDTIYLKFVNNELANSKLLIELLVFLVFGSSFANSKFDDEDINNIELINNYNKHHTTYLRYLIDRDDILQYVDSLLNTNVNLIPYSNINDHRLLVLDDLQFLNIKSAKLLYKILKSLTKSNHTTFIITAQRESNLSYEELENFIIKFSYVNVQKIKIEIDDVKHLLECYDIENLPKRILDKLIDNIFILKKFISIVKNEKETDTLKLLSKKEVKALLANNDAFYKETYDLLNKEEKKITDIIYFFNIGIKPKYLLKKFREKSLDKLIQKKVIKYDYLRESYTPFHDIYLEKFISLIKKNSKHLYEYAAYQKKKNKTLDYLSIIPNFPTKFIQNKDFFIKQIGKYHKKQNFFNVHYILKRYFSLNPDANNIGTDYEAGLLFFYYGYASFNVGANDGRELYLKTYSLLKDSRNPQENSLAMMALSEIANCDYWNLNIKSIEEKYKIIYSNFISKVTKNEFDMKAFSTITIRYYATRFFMDDYHRAEHIFNEYNTIIKKIKNIKASSLSLTKAINCFEISPSESYESLKEITKKLSRKTPAKTKLIFKSYLGKMGFLLGYTGIDLLENAIKEGQENNLTYNTKMVKLKLGLCYGVQKKYNKLKKILDEVIDVRDYPIFPQGIFYNLKALLSLADGDYKSALASLEKQKKCFESLGPSYQKKNLHNRKYISTRPKEIEVDFIFDDTKQSFCLESRF